ncbi:CDP-alcohol phosphatidyltransferase-domain-containing protein [Infundibulicybe gibba]|nr:CDP-alcohol phosphatidyltransferase-domain-containing protein [Infundibulicybe gibba]
MGYIPQQSLDNLKTYSYKGIDKSLLSRYILGPYWSWFLTFWPLSVAPNTITLIGLAIVIFNFLTMLCYEGGASGPPQWIYFTWGAGLFLYQSLDAIDGKQARRTGMAGPLGEIFDHGCDSLHMSLEAILATQALNLGHSWWTFAAQIATLTNFYLIIWEEYHTGQLYLGVCSCAVEGIITVTMIHMITGIYGKPTFWDKGILTVIRLDHAPFINKLPNIGLNEAFVVFGAFGLTFSMYSSYMNVRRTTKGTGKSTIRPLLSLVPFIVATGIQITWLSQPEYNRSAIINSSTFIPFLCACGLQFAHQVGQMILAHITNTPLPCWDWIWIWSVIGAVDASLPHILGRPPIIQTSPQNTALFVWATLIISFIIYARFCTLVIRDITNHLGIACFTVRKRDENGIWRHNSVPGEAGKKSYVQSREKTLHVELGDKGHNQYSVTQVGMMRGRVTRVYN